MIRDKFQFHYGFQGKRNQPVILFLHGFMGNSQEFTEVIALLSEEFCCLSVDLPGHGKTKVLGADECYSMSNTADALIDLLDQLAIKKCILIGYSMGGRLALYLNLHFPQQFSKVILESASPGLKTQQEQINRVQQDLELAHQLETSDFLEFLSFWYDQPLFASLKKHPEFENLLQNRLQNNPQQLAKSLRYLSTGRQPCLWEKLKTNKNLLLLLVGEHDQKFKAINAEMVKHSELAQMKIVTNCGHNTHFENPEAFALNVQKFLVEFH